MNQTKPTVERDANGVPTSWLLVRAGPIPLRKNGADYVLELTSKDLSAIEAYQKSQGERIPIDSNHYLHILAQRHGIEESDALKIIPSGVAAMGFGSLDCRADGSELWISAEWTPNAYELLKEKIFRYFSPVFRGLKNGPLRITSVAMENEPALNDADVLAAGSEDHDPEDTAHSTITLKQASDPMERALGRLLGRALWDEIVLTGEDDETAAFERTAAAIEAKAETIEAVREGLGVKDDEPDAVLPNVLKAVRERADMADSLREELDTLTCAAERKRKDELIARGLQEGKLTNALAENWAKEQDCAVLAAYLEHAPAAIPGRMEFAPDRKAVRGRNLSEADEAMIRRFGFDKDEYQQAKQG